MLTVLKAATKFCSTNEFIYQKLSSPFDSELARVARNTKVWLLAAAKNVTNLSNLPLCTLQQSVRVIFMSAT